MIRSSLIALVVLAGCGRAEPSCGSTTFDFEPDCDSFELRLGVATALVGVFETDARLMPQRPAHVVAYECAADDDCTGLNLNALVHKWLHEVDLRHGRVSTLIHYQWDEKGYTHASDAYDRWNGHEEEAHPLKK